MTEFMEQIFLNMADYRKPKPGHLGNPKQDISDGIIYEADVARPTSTPHSPIFRYIG